MPTSISDHGRENFFPRLRTDVRVERGGRGGTMTIVDPAGNRRYDLHGIECMVALLMNGEHTVAELHDMARAYHPGVRTDEIENFVQGLARFGLLEKDETLDFQDQTAVDADVIPLNNWRISLPPPPEGDAATFIESVDIPERPSITEIKEVISHVRTPPPLESETELDNLTPLIDRARIEEPKEEDPTPLIPPAVKPAEPAPAEQAPAETAHADTPSPPWHAHPVFRRFRVPLVLGVLLLAAAVIPYPRYVTDECTVLPQKRVAIRAEVEGILSTIKVDEGTLVEEGQVLAELDPRQIDAELDKARAERQRLAANLEKMKRGFRKEEIERAVALAGARAQDLRFAQIEMERKERLFSDGLGSAEARDAARREYQVLRSSLAQAQAELKLMRAGFREEEIKIAEAELQGAEAQVRFLERRKEQLVIRSPIRGKVTTPRFRERLGTKVSDGDVVCEVADQSVVDVEIYVSEHDVDVLAIGEPTTIKVRSLPLHPFKGRVTFIAPIVTTVGDRRVVRTITSIENPEDLLQEGMSGYGEIETGRATLLQLGLRRFVRWVRVRFLI